MKLCFLGIHSWTKWEEVSHSLAYEHFAKFPTGTVIVQKRQCTHCCLVKFHEQLVKARTMSQKTF